MASSKAKKITEEISQKNNAIKEKQERKAREEIGVGVEKYFWQKKQRTRGRSTFFISDNPL